MKRLLIVAMLTMSLVAGVMQPAMASGGSGGDEKALLAALGTTGLPVAGLDPADSTALFEEIKLAEVSGRTEIVQPFGDGSSMVVVKYEPKRGEDVDSPQWSVGLGWYIYIYLSRSNWQYLAGLGAAGATAALCWWLTATLVGAVACGIATYIVTSYILRRAAPPSGYCAEFRFTYGGSFAGYKHVRRSC